jgi:hypothetical protein
MFDNEKKLKQVINSFNYFQIVPAKMLLVIRTLNP